MAKSGKIVMRWLLIITMMIQPALFSHAMASMEHGDAAIEMVEHDMHHASDAAIDAASSDHHSPHDQQQDAKVDNCCHTPACAPALFVDAVLTLQPLRPLYPRGIDHALYDVDLPVNIKPPRTPA
jgi:hypothetical protein